MKTVGYIDGDLVLTRTVYACTTFLDWGCEFQTEWTDIQQAIYAAHATIKKWANDSGSEEIFVAMGSGSFRRNLLSTYKNNRKPRPKAYNSVVNEVLKSWNVMSLDQLEADDILGIAATKQKGFCRNVMITIDKDLCGVPGWLFNPLKDDKPKKTSRQEADYFWMLQTLTGDAVDGYAGCPGIGKVKAKKALNSCRSFEELWSTVVNLFLIKGKTYVDALTQARISRILRASDITDNGEIKLWEPEWKNVEEQEDDL